MKHFRHIITVALTMLLALAVAIPAFAQTQAYTGSDGDGAKITITNAANGETYKVAKLFDATVTGTTDGSIAYQGTIPSALSAYFTADSAGNISATSALDLSNSAVQNALKTWAAANVTAQAASDGSTLEFTNLPYGYYIITTTQGETLLTVDSTNPNASVFDKNSTTPLTDLSKTADDKNVFIGQTVTYTVKFATSNYNGTGADAKQILSYIITDTPASGSLDDITVTSIVVDNDGDVATTTDQTALTTQQFNNNAITIPWASGTEESGYTSLYKNGAYIIVTYTGKVADTAAIAGSGNTNTVAITFTDTTGTKTPENNTVTETIKTYAIAIKKVDQSGSALAGATFQLPFYVKSTAASDGAYIYAGTTAGTGLTNELTTPAGTGLIIVKGVEAGTYSITETKAPDGYNKLTAPVSVEAQELTTTTTSKTVYLDAEGNVTDEDHKVNTVTVELSNIAASSEVVVNKTGAELPSTGGMGTTIFYVVGGALVITAGIALVTKRRMAQIED